MMEYLLSYQLRWFILGAILIEIILVLRRDRQFPWRESLTSLSIAIGHALTSFLLKSLVIGTLTLVWHYRCLTIPLDRPWSWPALLISLEFFYYWHHRFAHRIRWFWATHAVHHSPNCLNLAAAYRLGWTGIISGHFLCFAPLVWLGFAPVAVLTGLALNVFYQFWLHTELIPKLGPLEWVLNTPSHHRVHHASNPEYIDRNYGGVLIIFDRLFGTFAAENPSVPITYGLVTPIRSQHPVAIVFAEWRRLWQDVHSAKTKRQRWQYLCNTPDWQPSEPITTPTPLSLALGGDRNADQPIQASPSHNPAMHVYPGS
jgi:sterol desaturase/sphingolipid hydroxylase (fatty acid hydroxylase superfamily)